MNAPIFNRGSQMTAIPCSIVRGGTSKGVFILDAYLPTDPVQRDRVLLELMGSPDPRQIDGLGGADPLTSKVAIIAPSTRPGFDIEYESVEVGIAEARVNHGLMCGNLLAGVGHFALAEGLIKVQSPVTTIKIYCRSNQKTIVAKIPVTRINSMWPTSLDKSTPVSLAFYNPGGAITGQLLPTGVPISRLSFAQYTDVEVSIVDAGTLYAFVRADALGLIGSENATALDGDGLFRVAIEALRGRVAEHINAGGLARSRNITPQQVKVAIIGTLAAGQHGADIVARIINAAKVHKAYAVSGGICLAAAAAIQGSLVNQIVRPQGSTFTVRIAHPSGILSLQTYVASDAAGVFIHAAEIERSARIILRGTAYVTPQNATFSTEHHSKHAALPELVEL
jgi:2-methylaconitate cis-trans-isomerase PrpF